MVIHQEDCSQFRDRFFRHKLVKSLLSGPCNQAEGTGVGKHPDQSESKAASRSSASRSNTRHFARQSCTTSKTALSTQLWDICEQRRDIATRFEVSKFVHSTGAFELVGLTMTPPCLIPSRYRLRDDHRVVASGLYQCSAKPCQLV
jgi:hypothetical protein